MIDLKEFEKKFDRLFADVDIEDDFRKFVALKIKEAEIDDALSTPLPSTPSITDAEIEARAEKAFPVGYTSSGNAFRKEGFIAGYKSAGVSGSDSVEFAEFIIDEEYEWSEMKKRWIPKSTAFISPDEMYTTQQLYQQFKLQTP